MLPQPSFLHIRNHLHVTCTSLLLLSLNTNNRSPKFLDNIQRMLEFRSPFRCIMTPTLEHRNDSIIANFIRMIDLQFPICILQIESCVQLLIGRLVLGETVDYAGLFGRTDVLETFEVELHVCGVVVDLFEVAFDDCVFTCVCSGAERGK